MHKTLLKLLCFAALAGLIATDSHGADEKWVPARPTVMPGAGPYAPNMVGLNDAGEPRNFRLNDDGTLKQGDPAKSPTPTHTITLTHTHTVTHTPVPPTATFTATFTPTVLIIQIFTNQFAAVTTAWQDLRPYTGWKGQYIWYGTSGAVTQKIWFGGAAGQATPVAGTSQGVQYGGDITGKYPVIIDMVPPFLAMEVSGLDASQTIVAGSITLSPPGR